jgi:hypothetical protein
MRQYELMARAAGDYQRTFGRAQDAQGAGTGGYRAASAERTFVDTPELQPELLGTRIVTGASDRSQLPCSKTPPR